MLEIPLLLMINEPGVPSSNRFVGVHHFTAVDQDDHYLGAAGSIIARYIQEFYGCQSQMRSPGAASKGDPAP